MKKYLLIILALYSLESYSQDYSISYGHIKMKDYTRVLNIDSLFKRVAILEKRVDSLQAVAQFKRRKSRHK